MSTNPCMQNMSFVAARSVELWRFYALWGLPGAARSCQERPPGAKIQEQLVAANPRSHAIFQIFYSISCFWMFNWQPFLDLINSKDCTHEYNILNFSDLEKVDKTFFKITKYRSEKKYNFLAKEFWSQCHILRYQPPKITKQIWVKIKLFVE